MKHKTEDYKISAVKYYLKNTDSFSKTCKVFDCKKSSLQRWVKIYKVTKNLTRCNRKSVSYKVKKEHVKSTLDMLNKNEQLTMDELLFDIKHKYNELDITRQHLGRVIRANNRTRKRTIHEHFPKQRHKKPTNKQSKLDNFYKEVRKYPIEKIICLDETSVGSHLKPTYSRYYLVKRCVIKTNDNFVFRSFTLLVAINNSKCVCKIFYEKGGTTKERMVEFLETQIFPKYKDHFIILDNAKSHNNDMVKEAILKSGNKYLFSVPYTPKTNAIEMWFNQLKTYLKKNRDVYSHEELGKNIDKAIERVKPSNYKSYFKYTYEMKEGMEYERLPSTRKRKLKSYKE